MGQSSSSQFAGAVSQGDVNAVQRFLKGKSHTEIEEICDSNNDGLGVLHLAVKQGDLSLIRILLDAGSDPNHGPPPCPRNQTPSAWTPIHEACRLGRVEALLMLLQYGGHNHPPNDLLLSPLGVASIGGQTDILTALVDNGWPVDEEVSPVEGETALVYAVRAGDSATSHHLLLLGARLNCRAWDSTKPTLYCQGGSVYKGRTYEQLAQSFDKSLSVLTLAIRNTWLDTALLLVVHGFNVNKYTIVDIIGELKLAVGVMDDECRRLVECYVAAGYKRRQQDERILADLEEADAKRLFSSFPDNFLSWVSDLVLRLPSLVELTRTCIRTRLRVCGGQRSLWGACSHLGLPPVLCGYVALQQYMPGTERGSCRLVHSPLLELNAAEYRAYRSRAKKQRHVYIQFWQASCCFGKH